MEFRVNKSGLLDTLSAWNQFLKKKIHLIACGGTAMTLLGIKSSTKDIDFLVPVVGEYDYLLKTLKSLGYKPVSGYGWAKASGFIFDLFVEKKVFTTELLQSPLDEGQNIKVAEFSRIYLGVLNYHDLIISKLFRGSSVDFEDCLLLLKNRKKEINLDILSSRFKETGLYEISEEKVNKNLAKFLKLAEDV